MAPDSRMVNPLLQCTLEMRVRFGAAPEPHALAKVIPPLEADSALAAWNADLERHAVAHFEARDLGPDGDNHAARLMPERERHAGTEIAIGKFLVVGDIRAADAGGLDSNLQLTGAWLFDGSPLLKHG